MYIVDPQTSAGIFLPAADCSKGISMSTKNQPLPTEPQLNAANKGVAVELSDEGLRNLAGYFDVLIQMDFAQKQRNERNKENGNDLQDTTSITT